MGSKKLARVTRQSRAKSRIDVVKWSLRILSKRTQSHQSTTDRRSVLPPSPLDTPGPGSRTKDQPQIVSKIDKKSYQNRAQIGKTSMQKSSICLMSLGIGFWLDVGGCLVPKWSQGGIKMKSTIDGRAIFQKSCDVLKIVLWLQRGLYFC